MSAEALAHLRGALPSSLEDTEPVSVDPIALRTLIDRLRFAEDVCLVYGWTGAHHDNDREKALHELWSMWIDVVGLDYSDRRQHRHLSDAFITELARIRDETRERTLAAIKADPS